MEIKRKLHNEGALQNPFLLFLILGIALIFIDPFHLGPLGNHSYQPVKHDIAPYKQVMEQWPRDHRNRLQSGKLEFVDEVYGPESIEFDLEGLGPYTGLADGRIVRWKGGDIGWETFAVVTPNWSEKDCSNGIASTTPKQHRTEARCGRPLGLRFDRRNGDLYIADAYFGLLVVGREGGIATPLATHADGKPIMFANDLDIHSNGSVFFTDTSRRYRRRDFFLVLLEGEATGRLLRYDPSTKMTHVVLQGLAFPNGVQISADQTFLLVTETTNCRIMRYWLEGPMSGQKDLFANLPGFPDNVRINEKGEYWVAIDCCRTPAQEFLSHRPWLRALYFKLPFKMKFLASLTGMKMYTVIALFDKDSNVVEVLEDRVGGVVSWISEVREENGKLWIGTVAHNHIATLVYP